MKKLNFIVITIFLMTAFSSITSFDVKANASVSKKKVSIVKKLKLIEMKCHVEFLGGGETIHFVNTTKPSSSQLTQMLVGAKISTSMINTTQEVYKVKECVKLEKDFKTAKAKLLDEETVR